MLTFFDKLYKGTRNDFFKITTEKLEACQKMFVVTANPEAFFLGTTDEEYRNLLTDSETTVIADGIGIVKAANMLDVAVSERIPGVELAEYLLSCGNNLQKSVYLLGAKPEVLKTLCKKINQDYPNLIIAGCCDGYVEDKSAAFEEAKALNPDIILVALGMPLQEKLIYRHFKDFEKGIFVGVGGSFDVLSGTKERAPDFFIKHNIEWLYRIAKEPKRIKRFYNNNIKFLFEVRKLKSKK